MISRPLASMLLFAGLAFGLTSTALAQAQFDPHSLIGEWVGKWTAGATGMSSGARGGPQGPYSLVITRVEGDRVYATLGTPEYTGPIRATLSGSQLSFGNERFQTELAVDGNQMRGSRSGGGIPPREILLLKE